MIACFHFISNLLIEEQRKREELKRKREEKKKQKGISYMKIIANNYSQKPLKMRQKTIQKEVKKIFLKLLTIGRYRNDGR